MLAARWPCRHPRSVVRDTADDDVLRPALRRRGSDDWRFVTRHGRLADRGCAACRATSPVMIGRSSGLSPVPPLPMEDS